MFPTRTWLAIVLICTAISGVLLLDTAPARGAVTGLTRVEPTRAKVPWAKVPWAKLTQSQAEVMLREAGVSWSSSAYCANPAIRGCTSFERINRATIEYVITIRRASGCEVNVTAGTEVGHAGGYYSHQNGYKVDISQYICVSNYITSRFVPAGLRADGHSCWRARSGNLYCREESHWDITYF